MLIAHTELLLQIIMASGYFLNAEKYFYLVENALSEVVIEFILNYFVITLRLYCKFERKL